MILAITWNVAGQTNFTSFPQILTDCKEEMKKNDITDYGIVICFQEISNLPSGSFEYKFGRDKYQGYATDKYDSGNQRCNTAILWNENLKYQSRDTKFYGNRYWETVKLSLNEKNFWVMSIHGPSMGPKGYAQNGEDIGNIIQKNSLEKNPIIALGDMNCQPRDMIVSKKGSVVSSGKPTRIKSQTELDFMVIYGATAEFLTTSDAGNVSDHLGVGFKVEL